AVVPVPSPLPVVLFCLPLYKAFGLTAGFDSFFSGVAISAFACIGFSCLGTAGASSISCVATTLSVTCCDGVGTGVVFGSTLSGCTLLAFSFIDGSSTLM